MNFETLSQMQHESCDKYAERPIFGVKKAGRYEWQTFEEFGQLVDHCRGGLASKGVGKGDRVAIISNNAVEWAVAAYATYGLGAIFVPMYEAQLPKDWKYILGDSGAKVLIVANEEIYAKTKGFVTEVDTLEHVVSLTGKGEHGWDALLKAGEASPAGRAEVSSDDVAGLIYTSGTTGKPKGVVLTHGNFLSNVNAVHEVFPMLEDDCSLSFLPWAHSFGQTCELHTLMSMGASLGLAESVSTLIENFSEVRPTLLFSVPRIFNRIYDGLQKRMAEESGFKRFMFNAGLKAARQRREAEAQGRSPGPWVNFRYRLFDKLVFSKVRDRFGGRLRYAFSGGAALSPEVAQFIDDMNILVYEGYGLTETSPIVTANRPGARRIGSVGTVLPGVTVVIDGADGKPNVEGEVLVCGPNVMEGYYNLDEQTQEVIFEKEGKRFFRTGDLGKLDEDGFLWITGRVKEIYKLENGKYVAPAPLEEKLQLSGFMNQVVISGDNKPFNVALIVPDADAVKKWAQEQGLGDPPLEKLCQHEAVRALIQGEIDRYSEDFKGYEKPRAFVLAHEEFTVDNDLLTPSMKYKRRNIVKVYGDRLEALYQVAPKAPPKPEPEAAAEPKAEAKAPPAKRKTAETAADKAEGAKEKAAPKKKADKDVATKAPPEGEKAPAGKS